ncbi:MFS transporter [Vagococcus fluvialis]|uniref:MFS transporter n=1 Tax=Vagococcus fluvialis TaxID=2738 RepID=UPI003B2195C8
MSAIENKNKRLILLMAITCGVAVANLYYIQPVESMISESLNITHAQVGFAATIIQIGYAIGLFFIVPMGDLIERKKLIMILLSSSALTLFFISLNQLYSLLLILLFILGFSSVTAQIVIPFAAVISSEEERGKNLGVVLSGLLIGILLSRTVSGFIGSQLGWRYVFVFGSLMMIVLLILVGILFPKDYPTTKVKYKELILSLFKLFKEQKEVREAAVNGFFMFGSFSAFWTSLIFLLASPIYNLGAKEAGLLGLVGVVGALVAPFVGKIADNRNPNFTIGIGTVLSFIAYIVLALFGKSMIGLVLGVLIIDIGNQTSQVSNQTKIQNLKPEYRSRNNTLYMFSYFVGGATGSLLSSVMWQQYGWLGVCLVGITFQLLALVCHYIIFRERSIR